MSMSPQTKYKAEETRWLLQSREHPLNIASALRTSPYSLYRMGLRHNLPDIQAAFRDYAGGGKS